MPPPRIFFYLLLDKFDQNLITKLSLSIGLSIVWRWIEQLNLVKFGKGTHLLWYKWRTLIRRQSLWNTEYMNNMLSNKLNYLLMCHILQRNCPFSEIICSVINSITSLCVNYLLMCPFSEIICSNQHEAMPLWRWRINLPNKIQPPTSERPRFNNRMHQRSRYQLQITKPLTFFTPLIVSKTIGRHGGPIETSSSE